jgi:hypothetical protein
MFAHGSARGNEKSCGNRRVIRPGNRGKDDGAGPSLPCPPQGGKGSFHQFLWAGSHPPRNANQELSGEARTRNRARAESEPSGSFDPADQRSGPEGSRLLLRASTGAQAGRDHPATRLRCTSGARKRPANSGSGRMWQSSQNLLIGADGKTVSPNCNAKVT